MVISLLWIDLISNCRHSALSPIRISKHLINLICRKCGLACAIWKSDLVDGPVIDYTEEEKELLKWKIINFVLLHYSAAVDD